MKLVITEKAIAGRRIAEILAGKKVPQTTVKKTPAFKFEKDGDEYVVLPLRGHIVNVDFPIRYNQWIGTDLRSLNKAEIEYKGTEKTIIDGIKIAAKEANEVIIATDADREGESIGVEALNYVQQINKNIKAKRAYFSAIIPKDITDAFDNLVEVDRNLADSADSRREIDLIWGAVLTRFLSIVSGRLGKDFLSVGRVQSPTLAILVEREKERLDFKKEKYWLLKGIFEKDKKKFETEHKTGKFWKKEEAENALEKKDNEGKVTSIKSSKRTLKKPVPFNTTYFLRAATAIGLTAGDAMNQAESLYQEGYISYPRTDNLTYPKNLDLKAIRDELRKVPDFVELVEKIESQKKIVPSSGKETKDHPPIHPVTAAPKSKLSDKQWKVYELVCRRFLATLSEEAETQNQTVEIDVNGEPYVAKGQLLVKPGWKELYPYSTVKEVILPEMKENELVNIKKIEMEEKETQPPNRYSQSGLIKLMDDLSLGTKSTRPTILQKLYYRQYISGLKSMEPSKVAFAVIATLKKYAENVTKPEMTAKLEKQMDLIAEGKKTKEDVVTDSRNLLGSVLEVLLDNKDKIGSELRQALIFDSYMGKCDKCEDGFLRKLKSRNNKWFLGCTNYPKCTNTYPLPQKGKVLSSDNPCEVCGKPKIKVIGTRYRFEMCVDPDCKSKDEYKKRQAEKAAKKDEKSKN